MITVPIWWMLALVLISAAAAYVAGAMTRTTWWPSHVARRDEGCRQ